MCTLSWLTCAHVQDWRGFPLWCVCVCVCVCVKTIPFVVCVCISLLFTFYASLCPHPHPPLSLWLRLDHYPWIMQHHDPPATSLLLWKHVGVGSLTCVNDAVCTGGQDRLIECVCTSSCTGWSNHRQTGSFALCPKATVTRRPADDNDDDHIVNMLVNVHRNRKTYWGRRYGGVGGGVYTYRYNVTTGMTSALRWAAMRAILTFH